jgi:hypothetical protein
MPASGGGIALVTHVAGPVTAGSGGGVSAAINTTGANFLVLNASFYSSGCTVTVSDSNSNTWAALTGYSNGASTGRFYYAVNPKVGSGHTFTVSGSSCYPSFEVAAFSGMKTSGVFDSGTDSGANGNSATIQPGSVTPPSGYQLVMTGVSIDSGSVSSVNSSFTMTDSLAYSGGNNFGSGMAYLVQHPGAAVDPTWTISGYNHTAVNIAAFAGM